MPSAPLALPCDHTNPLPVNQRVDRPQSLFHLVPQESHSQAGLGIALSFPYFLLEHIILRKNDRPGLSFYFFSSFIHKFSFNH